MIDFLLSLLAVCAALLVVFLIYYVALQAWSLWVSLH